MKFQPLLVLVLVLSSCSLKTDTELYTDAKVSEANKKFIDAVELYNKIVDKFPTTATAESSLVRLSVIYNNDIKDPWKSINTYHRFCSMFPNSKQAPTMLFLSGFVFNNELHMLDSARIIYETFLQKYPENDLAASAKFELETLGKDPGSSINSQTASVEEKQKESKKVSKK